jgi:hypothetical protein
VSRDWTKKVSCVTLSKEAKTMDTMKRVMAPAMFLLVLATGLYAGNARVDVPLDGSPSRGPENAEVVIVEFLDYQ